MKKELLIELYDKRREDLENQLVGCKVGTPEYHRLISEYNRLSVLIAKIEEKIKAYQETSFRGGFRYF